MKSCSALIPRLTAGIFSLFLILSSLPLCTASISKDVDAKDAKSATDPFNIAVNAYVYGYPLVTMEMTRRVMTNVEASTGKLAPMGQFAHLRAYPTAADKEVTAPNADTLYSLAWLDLSKEPYILSIPDAAGRFYLMPMLDGWTTVFADPGTRATGTNAQKYAIVGPGWKRKLSGDLTVYKAATNMVWILGRTYSNGTPEDYAKVHAFQDQLILEPLSAQSKEYKPAAGVVDASVDMKTPVREQVNRMDGATYFKLLAKLLRDNPPTAQDGSFVSKLSKIGIVPGQEFDANKLGAEALERVPKAAQEKITAQFKDAGTLTNGWLTSLKTGIYGTDYLQRAFITALGLGANRPQDAVYPSSEVDADGKAYDGNNRYAIHFDKGQIPPVEGFWSLTMYDAGYFFVENPLNRYSLGSRSPLKYNEDGSLDMYFQKEWPGKDKQSNWLPAPDGKFNLMLRMYWPKPEVVEGKYTVPPVRQVK